MVKAYATITFAYEMDESDEILETDQIRTDQDDFRQMVKEYFLRFKVEVDNLDVAVEIA